MEKTTTAPVKPKLTDEERLARRDARDAQKLARSLRAILDGAETSLRQASAALATGATDTFLERCEAAQDAINSALSLSGAAVGQ